ncbi:MAG: cation-binding protein, partial [Lapillicoccus sp.]
ANSDHMAEEERQDLTDFRQHATLELRHDLAVHFLRFEAQHWASGVPVVDKDPEKFVEDHEE